MTTPATTLPPASTAAHDGSTVVSTAVGPAVYVSPSRPDPIISMTDSTTPLITVASSKAPRKVQCRGLTSNNKNIMANTMTVLNAMIQIPPFVPYGRKRVAWEKVAQLCQARNKELAAVTGALCEARYILVRDEYRLAQATAIRRTGGGRGTPYRAR
ncbi:hypothetical protein EMPS_00538 [Entomortierella parvispora]|uniref:Uncharacterized protein n=1 Tax=Entomortierella parvispora TaxID=205924 RepID=A0A9P3H1X4_9FUNG|nr:hypothetical protein EMPS_00538 [Entomortierella parvispora]